MQSRTSRSRLAAVVLAASVTASAAAADLHVAPGGSDAGNDCRAPATPCATLQHAVDLAAAGDTLHAAPGTYVETLTIATSLSLIGAGAAQTVVDGNRLAAVVHVAMGARVAISGLTLRNGGTSVSDGGGLDNRGDTELTDVVITANDNRIYWGGAIYNEGGITGTRVTLSASRANQGGALCNNYGASAVFTDSTISGNTGFQGGAYLCGTSGYLELVRCVVTGNVATDTGGGLFGSGDSCTMVLRDTLVADNSAWAIGGVLGGGLVTIDGSTIADNHSTTLDAGGLYEAAGTMRMTNSTVSGNTAGGRGGGLFDNAGIVELTHVTVTANQAASGGGVHVENGGKIKASHTLIAGNLSSVASDCEGLVESLGYDLIQDVAGCNLAGDLTGMKTGVDPQLGPRADNGGPTPTHALLPGSPAIDAGNPAGSGVATDQRGDRRPADGDCDRIVAPDIGSFELACATVGIGVFESLSPDMQGAVRVGDAIGSPFSYSLPPGPRLYYRVDDGTGFPALIRLVKRVAPVVDFVF